MALTKPRAYQIYDIDYKQATRAVTVANITLTGGAPALVDGVNLVAKDRVLVTGQTDAKQNGIYVVSVVGSGSDGTWVRSDDTNSSGELLAGTIVMVTEGTEYSDTQWKLTTNDPIIIGTSLITFVQNYSANSISAGSSNVSVQSNANVTISSAGTANVVTVANTGAYVAGDISATGNVAGNYILGNGAFLTGVAASYGNANVADYLASGTDTANIITTGNVQGAYILGNGSQLTGISVSSSKIFNGNSEANIGTANGNLDVSIGGTGNVAVFANTGVYVIGQISASGNITGGGVRNTSASSAPSSPSVGDTWYDTTTDTMFRYVYDGNNYFWQDISGGSITADSAITGYSNVNAVAYGEAGWAGNIIPSANAVYNLGNATNQWKSLYVSNTTVYIGGVPLTTDGNTLSVAGNAVVVTNPLGSTDIVGDVSVQGNVVGNYIIGNGSQLTGISVASSIDPIIASMLFETDTKDSVETLTNKTITGLIQTKVNIQSNNIDLMTANFFNITITTNTALTISNPAPTGSVSSFILNITNGGSATVTWWSGVQWPGGVAPTLTAAGRDVLKFFTYDGGTTWTGLVLGLDVK